MSGVQTGATTTSASKNKTMTVHSHKWLSISLMTRRLESCTSCENLIQPSVSWAN